MVKNEFGKFNKELAKMIDNGFVKYKLGFIPSFARYALVLIILTAPCLGMIIAVCSGGDESPSQKKVSEANSQKTDEKSPAPKSKAASTAGGK